MEIPVVMIVGPPRSGTSILGRVVGQHPRISTWVEPYYIWDHHFRECPHDERNRADATPEIKDWIRCSFARYQKSMGVDLVVDKSPRNSLKLPFIKKVFPKARYIFILRDGRDTVLSIKKQWEEKSKVFTHTAAPVNISKKLAVYKKWLNRRPLWRHKWQSLCFEVGPPKFWLKRSLLNRIRWEGRFGWGPRFQGWQALIDKVTPLEYCAYQWTACASQVAREMPRIPGDRKYVIKYEEFIRNPADSLAQIFSFLKMDFPEGFLDMIPEIWSDNANKWQAALTREDLATLRPIMEEAMKDLGYGF